MTAERTLIYPRGQTLEGTADKDQRRHNRWRLFHVTIPGAALLYADRDVVANKSRMGPRSWRVHRPASRPTRELRGPPASLCAFRSRFWQRLRAILRPGKCREGGGRQSRMAALVEARTVAMVRSRPSRAYRSMTMFGLGIDRLNGRASSGSSRRRPPSRGPGEAAKASSSSSTASTRMPRRSPSQADSPLGPRCSRLESSASAARS